MTPQTEPNRSVAGRVFTIERTFASVTPQRAFDAIASYVQAIFPGTTEPKTSGRSLFRCSPWPL
jgi:hypothetical protein